VVWRHAQPARPEGHHVQPHVGPLTAALQQRTSYIQAYYFRLLTLTAATGKLYANKKHELYIHMLYHNTAQHQSLQSSTETQDRKHQPYLNYFLELPLAMGVLVSGIPLSHSWRGAIRPAVFVVFMNVCRV